MYSIGYQDIKVKHESEVKILKASRSFKIVNLKNLDLKKSNIERKPSDKFVEITMGGDEIKQILGGRISGKKILKKSEINYPIGLYNYINTANRQSKATIPSKVGKVHSNFRKRKYRSLNEYRRWYLSKYPDAMDNAVNEILEDFKRFGVPSKKRRWQKQYIKLFVEDLIINQSYRGLKIQEAIFIKMADILGQDFRWSTNKEDSRDTDGFIGDIPISVKPKSSQQKKKAGVKRVYYVIDEEKNTLSFTFSL